MTGVQTCALPISCPNLDLDTILIAIRLATYGEMMKTPVQFGDLELEYNLDLRLILDSLQNQISWDPAVVINNELTVFVKPLTYKNISKAAIQAFETQKIMNVVNDESMSDERKLELFKESFSKMTQATIGTIVDSINRVESINGTTDDPEHIKEFVKFLRNCGGFRVY